MIGILLVSHGKMAEGIKDSVGMIVGDSEQFDTLALVPGEDVTKLEESILAKTKQLDSGKGVLVFVDLFGASPYNASLKCLPAWDKLNMKVGIITGMSLAMVVTAICNRDFSSLEELTKVSMDAAIENVKDAVAELSTAKETSKDLDDY